MTDTARYQVGENVTILVGSHAGDAATVEHVVYLGARREIRLKLADGSMAVAELTNDGGGGWSLGDKVIA